MSTTFEVKILAIVEFSAHGKPCCSDQISDSFDSLKCSDSRGNVGTDSVDAEVAVTRLAGPVDDRTTASPLQSGEPAQADGRRRTAASSDEQGSYLALQTIARDVPRQFGHALQAKGHWFEPSCAHCFRIPVPSSAPEGGTETLRSELAEQPVIV